MAYEKYFDLYLLAQKNEDALYYMVSFDVVNSQLLNDEEKNYMHACINIIVVYVYNKLMESEKELNRQVLIHDERFFHPWDGVIPKDLSYLDPYRWGDCFQFTVLRDTITKEQIINWVNECKEKLNMKEEFHVADGYYETNDYEESNRKFYRSYCMRTLETLHKPEVQRAIKRVEKGIKQKGII